MEANEEDIATFQAITGVDHETAEHVLEAHGWDLNRGLNFYMESSATGNDHAPRSRLHSPGDQTPDFDPDFEVDEVPPRQVTVPQAVNSRRPFTSDDNGDEQDATLTAALTASLRTENGEDESPPRRRRIFTYRNRRDNGDDSDEDYTPPQSQSYEDPNQRGRRHSARFGSLEASSLEDLPGPRIRRNRPRGAAAPDPILGFLGSNGLGSNGVDRDWPPPLLVDGRVPEGGVARPRQPPAGESEFPNMPEGINVEEAKMLEAALLGIPYEGRIPDFSQSEVPEPLSPSVLQQRILREEQDQAYQDSLQADKIKADTAEAQRQAESEALRKEEENKASAANAQRDYEREIEEKLLNLPLEPSAGDPDAITVLIRSPKGQKFGRRFRRDDLFSDLFSFVDVSGAPDFRPNHYKLVTQFPRRAFGSRKEGTLQEAGLTQKQEALFLEPL